VSESPHDHPHDDHGAPSVAPRPPASESRPTDLGRDRCHGLQSPSLDRPWVAPPGTEGRGEPGRDRPAGVGTPARSPAAPATREKAQGTASARSRPPLRVLLRFLRLSPSRFHAWRRRQSTCTLDDQSSCPRTSPYRLTPPEVRAIKEMVTSPAYRHVPTSTLAVLAQRRGKVWASPSTWYRLVRQNGWRRTRLRVHPAKPTVGLRRRAPTRCGTSTPPSFACSTGPAPICPR